ncbi:MAG: TetR/AcrR family transcriptional regulator [Acidimicrobiales bacterium]
MHQKLLQAGLAVLQSDGAAALTVRRISEEAGCSTTGIYTNFGGKNGLIEAIYIDGFESFDRALSAAYEADDLIEAGAAYRRWALANRMQYQVMFGRAVPDYEPSDVAKERAFSSFMALSDVLERRGAEDPLAQAYHVYASVHGHVMLELVGLGPPDPEEVAELYEEGVRLSLAGLA